MTAYDLIKRNEGLLKLITANGLCSTDYLYLPIIEEIRERQTKGEKTSFIVEDVARKYHFKSERTIYRLIRRFNATIWDTDILVSVEMQKSVWNSNTLFVYLLKLNELHDS